MSDEPSRPDPDHELEVDLSSFLPEGSRFATDDDDESSDGEGNEVDDDGWGTDAPAPEIPTWARDDLPPPPAPAPAPAPARTGAAPLSDQADVPPDRPPSDVAHDDDPGLVPQTDADADADADGSDAGDHAGGDASDQGSDGRDHAGGVASDHGSDGRREGDEVDHTPGPAVDVVEATVAPDFAQTETVDPKVEALADEDAEGPGTVEPDAGPAVVSAPEVDTTVLTRIEGELAAVDEAIAAIDAGDLARSPLLTGLLADDHRAQGARTHN